MTLRTTFATLLLLSLARVAFPQAKPATSESTPITDYEKARQERVLHAVRTTTSIVIDGKLEEAAWQTATPATNFIEVQPRHGTPASEQTEVRILYDDTNLYIGAFCLDSHPKEIRVNTLQKDFSSNNTDLFGLVLDTLHNRQSGFSFWTNPAGARRDTQIDLDGERTDAEWDGVWQVATSVNEKGWIAEIVIPFKTLRFTETSSQEWGLNMVRRTRRTNEDSTWTPLPLRSTSITRISFAGRLVGLDGVHQGRNFKFKPYGIGSVKKAGATNPRTSSFNAGFDLKYGFTPKLTLDGTFRTDFSQVEADEQQVNLTRFNLLFPEKREFFLESSGIFEIASTPDETANVLPFFSRRIGLSADGQPIPIVGGTRLSGRAGDYDLGAVAMRTEEDGGVPASTFLVGRVRRNLPGTSTIGAIFTSRDSTVSGDFNRLYGADTRLRFFDKKLDVVGYFLGTEGPDGKDGGNAGLLGAAWRDDRLKVLSQYEKVDATFRPDIGFVRRNASAHTDAQVSWEQRTKSEWLRSWIATSRVDRYAAPDGTVETRQESATFGIILQNAAQFVGGAVKQFEHLSAPFAIRPDVILPVGDYDFLRYTLTGNTDLSRAVSGTLNASTGDFWNGTSQQISGTLNLRAGHQLTVSTTLNLTDAKLPAGDFRTTLLSTRVLLGFTSQLFLSSFLQYNATINQFTSNTRFNFIHRPLSDLFVVYNERRDTNTQALIDRAFIVKFTNMFDF
ncbi:MAG: DUF5916 domain-containing protein [Vicinamibacterales bacterium]